MPDIVYIDYDVLSGVQVLRNLSVKLKFAINFRVKII